MVTIEDDKKKKSSPKFWHVQQEKILKTWGEQSACYRYMHYKAYEKYKRLSMGFTLPIIVISTVTGTANFAQQTFPASWQTLAPVVIGGLNLFSAILTTVLQFLKINELLESHRVSSIQYGKLSRSIRLQLTLPAYERSQGGDVMIETCGAEYDRLIEQSPPVPNEVIQLFEREFPPGSSDLTRPGAQPGCCGGGLRRRPRPLDITRPEIINITEISPYDSKGELTVAKEVRSAFRAKAKSVSGPVRGFNYEESKKEVLAELESLKEKSLVTRETSPPTVIQNTEPEHVTLEVSKVDELKKSFEKS